MLKDLYKETEARMHGAIQSLENDITGIRTGRANPALVDRITVEYYGAQTALNQLASVTVPDARTLMIRPFDISTLKEIERAILASNLGLTPNNDGKIIRLNLPALTEDRRRDLVKVVHTRMEEARVAVRNVRRDSIKDLHDFEKEKIISEDEKDKGEEDLQKLTDRYVDLIEKVGEKKQREILEI
jgi:ribosome recycling factor